jgi:hypothetical protein
MYLYRKCSVEEVLEIQILKLQTNTKMTHAICSPWKWTFTLVPLAPLIVF